MATRRFSRIKAATTGTTRRFRLTIGLAVVFLMAAPVAALAVAGFIDVPANHPHVEGIEYVSDAGISVGYADGTFKPQDAVTRGQMATFLYRASGNAPGVAPSVNADAVDGLQSGDLMAAGVYVAADGTVLDWFNYINGVQPVVADLGDGSYVVDIGFNPGDAMLQVTVDHNDSNTSFATAGVYQASDDDNDVIVDIWDVNVDGFADHAFYLQVYGE